MSKIKIFGLGGLNEMGKNTYVIEIDGKIFIMDAGIKYANDSMYGIDYILPNYKYLEDNKERIVGVFLTHAHQENMGGVFDLVEHLPKIRVYATKYTKELLLMNGMKEKNIVDVVANRKIGFKNVSVFPINVSHSVPDAVMYVINTHDGAIVYTGDFLIDPTMNGAYSMDLGKIAYVGKQGVLCLMSESVFSERKGHTSPHHRLTNWFKDTFNHADGRIIVSTLPVHLHTIQEIFDAANNMHKKIVVMGKRLQNIINMAIKNGYLNIKPSILGDLSDIESANSILLVCDDRDRPYATVDKIVNGNDKFINLKPTDTVVFAEPKYDATEKIFVRIQDEIAMMGASVVTIPNTYTILHHASQEDLMIMLNLVSPKYYMPVKGEYRMLMANAKLALNTGLGYNYMNTFIFDNGMLLGIDENGKVITNLPKIPEGSMMVTGNTVGEIRTEVLDQRTRLADDGIIILSAAVSAKQQKIVSLPEMQMRGFIYIKDQTNIAYETNKIFTDSLHELMAKKMMSTEEAEKKVADKLTKFYRKNINKSPYINVKIINIDENK